MSEAADRLSAQLEKAEQSLVGVLGPDAADGPVLSAHSRAWQRLLASRNYAITVVGLLLFAGFGFLVDRFLTADNLLNMVRQVSLVGILSVPMTYLFVAGELDISVGSVYGFLTVIMGILVGRMGLDPWVGAAAVIALGCVIGALNGLIVTGLGIPSFIVTLAGLTAYRSAALLVSGEQPSVANGSAWFYQVTGGYIGGLIPWLIVWMVIIGAIGGVFLAKSRFGAHLYATGGNLDAAASCGINTSSVKFICFVLTSAGCGLIAVFLFGWLHVAAATTGTGFEFRVIGALILGGVALTGGRGSVYGSLVGAVILGMLRSGLVLLGFSQHWEDVATGITILITATLDIYLRKLAERRIG
jgi:ribose/xylose/arabinose/galactoside ABC-type transport system permease subunit